MYHYFIRIYVMTKYYSNVVVIKLIEWDPDLALTISFKGSDIVCDTWRLHERTWAALLVSILVSLWGPELPPSVQKRATQMMPLRSQLQLAIEMQIES